MLERDGLLLFLGVFQTGSTQSFKYLITLKNLLILFLASTALGVIVT